MVEYKLSHKREIFDTPSGMWIALRPQFGREGNGWTVRVLNFATWKHTVHNFPDEAQAREYADLWRI